MSKDTAKTRAKSAAATAKEGAENTGIAAPSLSQVEKATAVLLAMGKGVAEPYRMELHALRLGDVAIGTNPFELFTAYGAQMKARSPAVQSFVVQLVGSGGYLPTELAVKGGGYSAVIQSSNVGPEGGQKLVDETVGEWRKLWESDK